MNFYSSKKMTFVFLLSLTFQLTSGKILFNVSSFPSLILSEYTVNGE